MTKVLGRKLAHFPYKPQNFQLPLPVAIAKENVKSIVIYNTYIHNYVKLDTYM